MSTDTKEEILEELTELLSNHDWYYRYSESHSDWTKGRNEGQHMDNLTDRAHNISEEFGKEVSKRIREANPHLK